MSEYLKELKLASKDTNAYEKKVWNKAIEAAAKLAENYDCYHLIKDLKK